MRNERRSLFRPAHVGTDVSASARKPVRNGEKRQGTGEDFALTNAIRYLRELVDWRTILSSMRIYVIVTSTMNKLCF